MKAYEAWDILKIYQPTLGIDRQVLDSDGLAKLLRSLNRRNDEDIGGVTNPFGDFLGSYATSE